MTVAKIYGGDKLVEILVRIDEILEEEDLVSVEPYEELVVAIDLPLREEVLLLVFLQQEGRRNIGFLAGESRLGRSLVFPGGGRDKRR